MSITITLPDRWLLIAPCGCIDGLMLPALRDGTVLYPTAESAWARLEPSKRQRDKDARAGWFCRASEEGEVIKPGCSHDPQWTKPEPPEEAEPGLFELDGAS